jgi:DNA-binding transcriptional regulator YbjK
VGKERGRNDERSRIAHLAARLMAEDGIEDYAAAKRKAARQAGVPATRHLPTNDEIDEALRAYRQLYQGEEHLDRLRELRGRAVEAMRELAAFNPYLTGSVLSGNAGRYADINLQLYTDNAKGLELYLIDRRIDYRAGQSRLYAGEEPRTVPVFTIEDEGVEIELTVLAPGDLRMPVKTRPDGRAIERAKLAAVEALLAQT